MSVRNRFVLVFVLLVIAALVGCGSSSNNNVVPPPSGAFSNSNLSGTYVFSVSGTDQDGAAYAIVGTVAANGQGGNGQGGITGGTLDINDEDTDVFTTGPIANSSINSNSYYTVGVDGRGTMTLGTSTPFGNITLDFVLQDSSHGLVTEFDGNASGSGTIDLQASSPALAGTYAFSFSGADENDSGNPAVTAGNFAIGTGGTVSGLVDFNEAGFAIPDLSLGGAVVLGPSSTPGTTLTTTAGDFESVTYDVYAIDNSHLKFIEMDTNGTLSGDAFTQSSATIPEGPMAFTLDGFTSSTTPTAAAGLMVTDSTGDITNASVEDASVGTTVSPAEIPFSGSYTAAGTGRYILNNFSGFTGGATYAAYPFGSGGLLLVEIGNDSTIMAGSANLQSSTTFAASEGYGLNFTGINLDNSSEYEVDDIAEFQTTSTSCGSGSGAASGLVVSGYQDENYAPGGAPISSQVVCGNYTTADGNGRGQIGTTTANGTLNGGFILTYYTVDGTTFPFIESDGGQVTAGVFVEQNASASSAIKSHHLFVARPLVKSHSKHQKRK
jgi:hypothetical protein